MDHNHQQTIVSVEHDSDKRGFTLIEVLVVVAIIALLASILLPSLRNARDAAKLAGCKANMKDLGNAMQVYASENDPYFPPTPYLGSTVNVLCPSCDDNMFVLWYRKYAPDVNLWSCPATTYKIRVPGKIEKISKNGMPWIKITTAGQEWNDFERIAQHKGNRGLGTSYEYNIWYNCEGGTTKIDWHPDWLNRDPVTGLLKTAKVLNPIPSRLFVMHEADDADSMANGNRIIGQVGPVAENNYPEPWDNHGTMGMNVLFADAHVELIKREFLKNPYDNGNNRLWQRQDCNPPAYTPK